MPVEFFFDRWHRAVCMDSANKLLGKPTHYWVQAEEWIDAYKQTLSNTQKDKFDKEWRKLEDKLENERHVVDWGKPRKKKK